MAVRSPERQNELRRRWLGAAGVLFIAAMLASTAHGLWTDRHAMERRASEEMAVLARVLAEQARRSLQTVEVMLLGIADDERSGDLRGLDAAQLQAYVERQRDEVSDVAVVFLTDAEGRLRASSGPLPAPLDRMAGRPAFQQLKAGAATAFDGITRLPDQQRWVLPILHRVVDRDGHFVGSAGALIDAGYFERFYADLPLGFASVIALRAGDGALLARHPPSESAMGQAAPDGWHPALALPPGQAPRVQRFTGLRDQVDRLGILQPVPGYPVHVVVTRDLDKVFAPWREAAVGSIARTLLLCAAAIGLLAVVLRQLRGLETGRASIARSELALRASQERYALAVAGSNEGLWDWDLASDEVFFSGRAQQVCGLAASEPLRPRRAWLERLRYHPQDRARVRDTLVAHLRGRAPQFDVEMRVAAAGSAGRPEEAQDWNWVRQRGLLVRDEQGRPRRMAGSIEDITPRKRAEAQREQLEVRLRTAQKLEAMGTLAGGIAHDFNNILGAILGYAELARGHAQAGSALQQQLDGVMGAGLRARSLVQRILAFSRSGLGDKLPVHVESAVAEALDLLEGAPPPGLRLARELHADDAAIVGDPAQVHQVVMNLVTNAIQASHAPGTVAVRLAPLMLEAPRQCTSGELAAGRYLELLVADEGAGMAPQEVERIFDPFYTTKDVGVGTGLGLSLVHGIVAELHGAIDVRSEPGRGSSFTVLLPWSGETTQRTESDPGDAALPRGEGERILLVDDEAPLVALGEETLAALGYEPVGFTSSVAALQALENAPAQFDALLSDEAMPRLTGTELAAAARRLRPDLPVLLMTGYLGPALAARAQAAGVQEVLAKPLVAADIARALARILPRA
ncbi:response regulator [Ramlibacter sp. G-1-2-2]|uniref:histidine kinase n=1 Tax=Ramlibacter agri TaxID=2728837 RepID=A0A848H8C6_9BURK|nr:ATP-binding protein [Ramlibacter agri]NML46202.1 response regulator [Ramlibacter agri]